MRDIPPITDIDLLPSVKNRCIGVTRIFQFNDAQGHAVYIKQHVRASIFNLSVIRIFYGKLIHGAALCAGEVEHIQIGLNGTWDDTASTWQLICNVAKEKSMPLAELNGKKIYAMAQAGDVVAAAAIAKQMDALAAGVVNICYILNPERVIVGGGISAQADYLYPQLDKALRKRLIPLVYENTILRFAALQNDAGMIGALFNFLLRHGKTDCEG